jgi:chemotaxis protein CheC
MAQDDTRPSEHGGDDPILQARRLSELERDALTEVVNIGVNRAANSLRDLIGEQVLLTVPSLAILTRAEAAALISRHSGDLLIAVRQAFQGEFAGSALLIFPEANSLELIRAVTKGELSLEDIIELEQEALAEIGNIILNSCMAAIANLLQRSLKMALPEIIRGSGLDFFESRTLGAADGVLYIRINFTVKGREISGYIAIVMDFLSLEALQGLIADFIAHSTR